jgi:cysteine synthase A
MSDFTMESPPPFLNKPKIAKSITDLIGLTPMLQLGKLAQEAGATADIFMKLESMEPCSSVKDRIAKNMIEEAERRNEITPGRSVLVEPTSGNTGIGLAMVAAAKGYDIVLVMPASMSHERRVMLKALGAKLVLTPPEKGMKGAIFKAQEIRQQFGQNGYMFDQFSNPDNVAVHRSTTGPEIWWQCDGQVDILVCGVGTGGTITGCAEYLRSVQPALHVVAVEPAESPVTHPLSSVLSAVFRFCLLFGFVFGFHLPV